MTTIKDIQTQIGTTPDGVWGEKSKAALRQALTKGVVIPITQNITLNELLASQTAARRGINNMPDAKVLNNLIESAVNLWQPVRDILGQPVFITSGYRSPRLNSAIGGAKNSAHMHGLAIDFRAPTFGTTRQIVAHLTKEIKKRGIKYDQLILEYPNSTGSWVHLGYKHPSGSQRGQGFRIG